MRMCSLCFVCYVLNWVEAEFGLSRRGEMLEKATDGLVIEDSCLGVA